MLAQARLNAERVTTSNVVTMASGTYTILFWCADNQYQVLLSSPLNISNGPQSQWSIRSRATRAWKLGSTTTEVRKTENRPVKHNSFPDRAIEHIVRCRNPNRSEIHSANQAAPWTKPLSFVVRAATGGERRKKGKTFCSVPGSSFVSASMNTTTPSGRGLLFAISSMPEARAGLLPRSPRNKISSGGHKEAEDGVNRSQHSPKIWLMFWSSSSQPETTMTLGLRSNPVTILNSRKRDSKTAAVIQAFS